MHRSTAAAAEVARINTFFPLMPRLGKRWARTRPWEGRRVALNAHLTTLTAALVRELVLGGGEWVVSAANEATTDPGVVLLLRNEGVVVETGRDRRNRLTSALDTRPEIVADVGFDLLSTLLDRRPAQIGDLVGAVEITRSGINRLRARDSLPFGVINLDDSEIKRRIENRHGVGEGILDGITAITGLQLRGRRVAIIGYGPVGVGLAAAARSRAASVEVVETDPIRRLVASYDGYATQDLGPALARAEIAITATGKTGALPLEALSQVGNDLVLVNAGHGADEISVGDLAAEAHQGDQLNALCVRYRLAAKGPWLTVLGEGNPLNIVLNAGSPEPVLLNFALLGLTLEWIAGNPLPPGELPVPRLLQVEAARLALQARG